MIVVFVVLSCEKFIGFVVHNEKVIIMIWAGIEEIIKFIAIYFIALQSRDADEPIDFAIYMMTGALGFAALENALFLIDPVTLGNATVSLLTGNFRFLGAMLLHTISSGMIGIAMGLSFYMTRGFKKLYLFIGLLGAITLHSIFNFLIISSDRGLFGVFSLLWGVAIIILLLFEQLRRM
jgi:RsiW-degrading membrane proteinase PrsW (M82 family)